MDSGMLTLIFIAITGLVALYSRSKTQQITIELSEKFENKIKEEKKNYALKLKELESDIKEVAKSTRVEYATKEELKKMEEHIDKRFDDLQITIKTTIKEAIKEII